MSDDQNRFEQMKAEQLDKAFAAKWYTAVVFAPGILALAMVFIGLAIGAAPETVNTYLVVAIFLNLVSVILDTMRRKILRQDEKIRQLQDQIKSPRDQ